MGPGRGQSLTNFANATRCRRCAACPTRGPDGGFILGFTGFQRSIPRLLPRCHQFPSSREKHELKCGDLTSDIERVPSRMRVRPSIESRLWAMLRCSP